MRLFVAVVPPEGVLASVEQAVAAARGDSDELRWAGRAHWHLTLAFLGEVQEQALPELTERLGRAAARTAPLTLRLARGGAFGSARRARIVWTGVDGDVAELRRLAERVHAAARRTGIAMEDRAFRPHVTLARARGRPVDATVTVAALSTLESPEWTAREITLVRSHLGGGPPRYEELTVHELRLRPGHQA